MKIISVLCAVATVASCAFTSNYYSNQQVQYNHHVPVIHDGVPVDTPEVQAAKAQHFEAYAKAQALAAKDPSDGQYTEEYHNRFQNNRYHQPLVAYSSAAPQSNFNNYNYLPVDTPEVQQAKNAHFKALSRTTTIHYRGKRSIHPQFVPIYEEQQQHIPRITKDGVPEDTEEVQQAKIQHLLAHAAAHFDDHHEEEEQKNAHENFYGYHIPLINRKGVPVDTSDVQLARQQHKLAHWLAETGTSYHDQGYSSFIPVIGPNGTPYDTPDVQKAKVEHLLAHAKEASKNYW